MNGGTFGRPEGEPVSLAYSFLSDISATALHTSSAKAEIAGRALKWNKCEGQRQSEAPKPLTGMEAPGSSLSTVAQSHSSLVSLNVYQTVAGCAWARK